MTIYTSSFGDLGGNKHPHAITTTKERNKIFAFELKKFSETPLISPRLKAINKLSAYTLEGSVNRREKKKENFCVIHYYLLIAVFFVVILISSHLTQACPGRFVNPLTDICWSCLFPISIGSVSVNTRGREDTPNPTSIPCLCPRPPLPTPVPGIPIGFWEPVRLVDVTRIPFCMVGMGGLKFGNSLKHYGTHSTRGTSRTKHSFYHVHWYVYPVIYWLELLVDFACLEQQSFDVAYLTEFDPLWNDDELSFILNPEAVVFANPIAQAACAADCAVASTNFPNDALFWCGGCQGSLYPFTGNNTAHQGGSSS